MKHSKLLFIILFMLVTAVINAQTVTQEYGKTYIEGQMDNPSDPFVLIQQRANSFFSSLREEDETEEIEQLEEFYRRWEEYWVNHCNYPEVRNGGDILGAKALMKSLSLNVPYCNTSPPGVSSWISEGPNPGPGQLCNVGLVGAIAIDPTNTNIIYAGSNTGGLFKTTDGGTNWANVTSNNITGIGIIPGLEIGAVEVDPSNSQNVIVGTSTDAFGGVLELA